MTVGAVGAGRSVHVDTDLGGDPDDAVALALLLARADVEVVGITTNLDEGGERAGCVHHLLDLAGRSDVPVAAGAGSTLTAGRTFRSNFGDRRYWPVPFEARPGPPGAALDMLQAAIAVGATVVTLGALTNLALLEVTRPGALAAARVVAMAGWVDEPRPGHPEWGPARDFNVQCDPRAAEIVAGAVGTSGRRQPPSRVLLPFSHLLGGSGARESGSGDGGDLTLVQMPASIEAWLTRGDVEALRAGGPLARLLADQSEVYGNDTGKGDLGRTHEALPDDLVNFHWDPVTAAVATGWPGAEVADVPLATRWEGEVLAFVEQPGAPVRHLVRRVDGPAFSREVVATLVSFSR